MQTPQSAHRLAPWTTHTSCLLKRKWPLQSLMVGQWCRVWSLVCASWLELLGTCWWSGPSWDMLKSALTQWWLFYTWLLQTCLSSSPCLCGSTLWPTPGYLGWYLAKPWCSWSTRVCTAAFSSSPSWAWSVLWLCDIPLLQLTGRGNKL